ncbi:hypothetical protein Godav_013968 [Gossypium davidsonii]|uniref:Uncharacterized protein n=2 Tax=Gossypium TaxID=3633 RepID=A0A7J8RJ07_GOSDV|nr:hypothetical protein [Gossypium davidsonii]MBA0648758.1 hypothetical protein [Gossypium klotzschianum]
MRFCTDMETSTRPSNRDMESYWICPLLVLRQYRSRQFISAMQRLAQCEFAYNGDNYKKKESMTMSHCQIKKTLGR